MLSDKRAEQLRDTYGKKPMNGWPTKPLTYEQRLQLSLQFGARVVYGFISKRSLVLIVDNRAHVVAVYVGERLYAFYGYEASCSDTYGHRYKRIS